MGFQLVPTSVTLNGLERHYDVILHLSYWMARLPELSFCQYKHVFPILLEQHIVWQWTCVYQV